METVRNLDKGGGELSFYRYAYDHSGFITSEEVRQRAEGKTELFTNTYTYDYQGQLVLASTLKDGKTSEIRYTYDKAGNRIAVEKNEDTILAYLEEYAYDEANRLMTASSEKERKLCASAGRISKGDTDGVGVVKGISQAITDIWNKSMSENPIGKVFLNQGKKTAPSIGSMVMEIAQRVIKEQEEIRKQEEQRKNIELSAGITDYFDQTNMTEEQLDIFKEASNRPNDSHYLYTEATVKQTIKNTSKFDSEIEDFKKAYEKNKAIYEDLSQKAGVPPELIAVLHYREGTDDYLNGRFNIYLHNGEKLGQTTTYRPAGKLFYDFEAAALDAFRDKQIIISQYSLSSSTRDIVTMMSFAEAYNGMGYYNNNHVNPYLYSGTNQYTSGKYIEIPNGSSGTKSVYDSNLVDEQIGVYLLLDSLLN